MSHAARPLTAESLLEHREWLRAIARSLVADENLVDDLEQRSWLKFLRRGAAVTSPRGWLRSVVRSATIDERRSRSRREAREAAAARPEALPPTDDLVIEVEAQRVVAQTVTALPEPYRTTVLLRYFEGLSLSGVAARMDAPVRTVQTRLRRAHALLRAALDREFGDRRAWCLLLAPLGRTRSPVSPGAAAQGAILMATKSKVAALGVAAVLLLGGWAWLSSRPGASATTRVVPSAAVDDDAVRAAARADPPAPEPPVPASAPASAARVCVVDPDGRPVAGAVIEYLRLGGAGISAQPERPRALGATDASGRLPWPERAPPLPGILRASHPDFAPSEQSVVAAEEEMTLRLRRGLSIQGIVVDEHGSPVAGAQVEASVTPQSHVLGNLIGVAGIWSRSATSAADGGFGIAAVPETATGVIAARAEGFADAERQWPDSAGRPLRLVLQRSFRTSVRLTDADGLALDGGAVFAFQGPRIAMTPDLAQAVVVPLRPAGDGRYESDELAAGWYAILAAHPGHRTAVVESAPVLRGGAPIAVVLAAAPGIAGRVVDAVTRRPVAGARVRALPLCPAERDEYRWLLPAERMEGAFVCRSGEDGSFAISTQGPGDDFATLIQADGYQWFHFPWKAAKADWLREIALLPLVAVDYSGRVVSTDGAPIPGAIVRGEFETVAAGADGRFRLATRTGMDCLTFLAPGFASRVVYAPGHDIRGGGLGVKDFGDVAMAPTREIRGTVVDEGDRPVPSVRIWATPTTRLHLPQGSTFGGAFGTSDDAGVLTLAVVPGVAYRVSVFGDARPGEVVVEGDAAAEFRLVLGADPRADDGVVRGRLRVESGPWVPVRAWIAIDRCDGKRPRWAAQPVPVEPDGTFVAHGVAPGTVRVRVFGSEDLTGASDEVAVAPRRDGEVVVLCRRTESAETGADAIREVRSRVAEGDVTPGLVVWATRSPDGRSLSMERGSDGAFSLSTKREEGHAVWAFDASAVRAGLALDVLPGAAQAAEIAMSSAGRVLLPAVSFEHRDQWVDIRDASGRTIWSGPQTRLPAIPGEGHFAVLPPGAWRFEVSDDPRRTNAVTWRGESVAGTTTRAER